MHMHIGSQKNILSYIKTKIFTRDVQKGLKATENDLA
jgi:hypothetical protein